MSRERRRLLIEPQRLAPLRERGGSLPLEDGELHYLVRVLRRRPGDAVALIDGCGGLWGARLGGGPWLEKVRLEVQEGLPPAGTPTLTLALALPRQEVELVWRMATELGIDRLQPLRSERCQVQGRAPLERWRTVVREATEQCERLWLPPLAEVSEASPWLQHPRADLALFATTRHRDLPSLEQVLAQQGGLRRRGGSEVTLAIGPEGGWSPSEEEGASGAGWLPISLGETILRSATAAVAGVSRLCAWRGAAGPLPRDAG